MVLGARRAGSGVRSGARPAPGPALPVCSRRLAADRGSQALEFALALPAVGFVLALVLLAGVVGMELVHAQGIAREAARAAAVGSDAAAATVARAAAGGRDVHVRLRPPEGLRAAGDLVTADVRLGSAVMGQVGIDVALPARATMRVEHQ